MIRHARKHCPGFRPLTVSGTPYHHAGASAVQELAFALAAAAEYLDALQDHGLAARDVADGMQWAFPVGTNFFFEIAKLRAARLLWAKVAHGFGMTDEAGLRMRLRAESADVSRTMYDPWVNMLRATLEVMAGALGGADAFTCAPFDARLRPADDFSARLARNTQIILQEESGLARVADPARGSYYIEYLTDAIARNAWTLFQEIERRGGFLKAFGSGWAQERIAAVAATRRERIARRRDVFIGTNQYPNLGESLADYLRDEPSVPPSASGTRVDPAFAASLVGGTDQEIEKMIVAFARGMRIDDLIAGFGAMTEQTSPSIAPLPRFRGPEVFERIRAAVERAEKHPRALLVPFGPAAWRRARATFAAGFLGVAGFGIEDHPGFASVAEAARAVLASKPDIAVLCSDDESYPVLVPEWIAAIAEANPRPLILVAGNPKEAVDDLRRAGVDEFIHVRSDAAAVLTALVTRLGITIAEEAI
jgi:methylmalonyl-CoA mutase